MAWLPRHLDDGRAGALGHHLAAPAAGSCWSSVATRYQLGFAFQAGIGHLAAQRLDAPRHLRVGHERGFVGGDVGRERRGELRAVEEQEAILRRQDRRHRRARRRIGDQRRTDSPLSGRERRDVDQAPATFGSVPASETTTPP